ncbi:hypothetical protein COO60DRAFT_131917 [Scenedesmus sp. NREL 46B-D3]|nr:hypothetical protein COO60DRAFT_131917 [Scenedesmus sp. NREL 46B-D3]
MRGVPCHRKTSVGPARVTRTSLRLPAHLRRTKRAMIRCQMRWRRMKTTMPHRQTTTVMMKQTIRRMRSKTTTRGRTQKRTTMRRKAAMMQVTAATAVCGAARRPPRRPAAWRRRDRDAAAPHQQGGVQERERLDGAEALPNTKPMMELKAGSNVWYQAYVLKESTNEAKVRFPDPDGGRADLLRTWVNKTSSRIWRGSYAHGDWQFLGKGAWKPRQKPKRSARGSGRRGNAGNGPAAGGGGGSQRRGASRATRSDGAGGSQQRKRARSARRDDDDEDEEDEERAEESSDDSATSSDAGAGAETTSAKRPQFAKQQQQPARKALSAPQPVRQQQRQQLSRLGGSTAGRAGASAAVGAGCWDSDREELAAMDADEINTGAKQQRRDAAATAAPTKHHSSAKADVERGRGKTRGRDVEASKSSVVTMRG